MTSRWKRADSEAPRTTRQDKKDRQDNKDILVHEAMALFQTARTDVKVVLKEDDRQHLKQLDVALKTMATQATRKLRLAVEKFGKALAWFERGATAGKLTTNAQLDSALKEKKKSEKQKVELLKAQINIRVGGYRWARFDTTWSSSTGKTVETTVADLTRRVKQMFADEKTKRLKTLGTLTIQASSSLAKRQASAEVIREVAAQLQAAKAAAAEATEVVRHDACALRKPG